MKLETKHLFAMLAVVVAFALVLLFGQYRCVSEIMRDKPVLRDVEREMCLTSSSGSDLEYWIDGERSTDGCHWCLEHVKCQRSGCLYKCKETEILWRLAKDGKTITMEKDVRGTNSNLPQQYHFVEVGR